MKTKDLEIYIHIPFCVRKCNYCDFPSHVPREYEVEDYIRQLIKEIHFWGEKLNHAYRIKTIFIGGGTPSILSGKDIYKILDSIKKNFLLDTKVECSMEVNPGTVTKENLEIYRLAGINRLSFGLQSIHPHELEYLGRIHTYETFEKSYDMARTQGFENINVDLMSAIPLQTVSSYEETLHTVAKLSPEHISAYSLIVEEGTPFDTDEQLEELLPSEEDDVEMYEKTADILGSYGYHRYEISNYSKKGYACAHNCGYWEGVPYLGFGLGAASYFEMRRFQNPISMKEYQSLTQFDTSFVDAEILSKKEQIEETMFLGLRMMKGVSKARFYQQFGVHINSLYGEVISKLKRQGLLDENEEYIFLTEQGYFLSNQVFVEFLFDV